MNIAQNTGAFGYPQAISLFESLASSTWGWLGDSKRFNLGFSEDTISDLNMLEVARSVQGEVQVGRVSKRRERFVGFDWMWLISRPGTRRAIYVVQAKKMRLDDAQSYSYGSLKYPSSPPFQIDALKAFADSIGAIPLYCFYNYVDDSVANAYWHCTQQRDPCQMGCTLAPLKAVRTVHDGPGKRDFSSIHKFQCVVPWRCLFHPKCAKFSFQEMAKGGSTTEGQNSNDNAVRDDVFEHLSGVLSGNADSVDLDVAIDQLNLGELVDIYGSGRFVPFGERILSIRFAD